MSKIYTIFFLNKYTLLTLIFVNISKNWFRQFGKLSSVLSQFQLLQLFQTVIGLLDSLRTLSPLGASPCGRTNLPSLVQQTLFHQQHSMVGLIHTGLVQFRKFDRQSQCFGDILFRLDQFV